MIETQKKRPMVQDSFKVVILFIISLAAGLAFNSIRSKPLLLIYLSPQDRLNEAVKSMGDSLNASAITGSDVSLNEMKEISVNHTALILDARPTIFYRLSHIPSALSLPRDDFKNRYIDLQKILVGYQSKYVVVYCAASDCQDSQMVANALERLDYQKVRVFREGWSKWEKSNLPEEKYE